MTGRFNPQPFQMFLTDSSLSNEMAQDFSVTPGVFNLTRYSSVRRVAIEKIIFSISTVSPLILGGFGDGVLQVPIQYRVISENSGDIISSIRYNSDIMGFCTEFDTVDMQGGAKYSNFKCTYGDGKPIINFSTGGNIIMTLNDNIFWCMLSFKCLIYGYYVD